MSNGALNGRLLSTRLEKNEYSIRLKTQNITTATVRTFSLFLTPAKNIFLIAACGKVDFNVIEKLSKYFDLILPACESTDISFCTKNSRKLLKELSTEIGKILMLRSSILNS